MKTYARIRFHTVGGDVLWRRPLRMNLHYAELEPEPA